jgi:hypothetical protein
MATAAIAVDGWFFDESAGSKEHPSPFFRNWSLLGFWCGYLQHCREEGWGNEVPPSASDLMTVTHAVLMAEWLAGAYRDGRGGATALHDDREQVHDWLCNAAGLAPPFRFVIQLPY